SLTQLSGPAGCVNGQGDDGSGPGTCTTARVPANFQATALAMSPDGHNLYAGAAMISVFDVNADGSLTQPAGADGCVLSADDGCADSPSGPGDHVGIAVAPDGRFVYTVDNYH